MAAIFLPRAMRVGAGALNELPAAIAQLGFCSPAIVTDPFLAQSGALDRLLGILGDAGLAARVFADVIADPTAASVDATVAFIGEGEHDCVIGFGGGSSIDTAKAAAVLLARGGTMRALKAPHQEDAPGLPIIAVPTTAGTGSEATRFTIITDEVNDEKMLCAGLAYMPVLAIVDYELTLSKPFRLTADTGIDALTHAVEAYVSRRANGFTDGLALTAISLIGRHLRRAYADGNDRRAREAMMLAATQAGIAFSNSSVALVHGMSRPIGAHFHVAHGLSNAMLFSAVTRYSLSAAESRYADCARALGCASATDGDAAAGRRLAEELDVLGHDLAVPTPAAFGIAESEWNAKIPTMVEQAIASGSPGNNPRIPSPDDVAALYTAIFR